MLEEKYFPPMNTYANKIDPEYAAQIAEFEEKIGITDLDDLNAPRRKVQRTDAQMRALEGIEKAKAEARAQAEYQAAQARLADGTAVLRQPKECTPIKTKKAAKVAAKPAKKIAKVAKPRPTTKGMTYTNRAVSKARREAMVKALKAGEQIKMINQHTDNFGYQAQYADVRSIIKSHKLNIKRIRNIESATSYLILDEFERYQAPEIISGGEGSPKRLLAALLTKKLVLASDLDITNKTAMASMLKIAKVHDFDIHVLFNTKSNIEGWIFIPDQEKQKAKLKVVGDLLQALDFLEAKKAKAGQ